MLISRSSCVLAVVASLLAVGSAVADDLAGQVAASLRDSGKLAGYRVNVKAKDGTVWLTGTVKDAGQIAAAVGAAENTPGVERVVNRLSVARDASATGGVPSGIALPDSIRLLAGMPKQAEAQAEVQLKAHREVHQEVQNEPRPEALSEAKPEVKPDAQAQALVLTNARPEADQGVVNLAANEMPTDAEPSGLIQMVQAILPAGGKQAAAQPAPKAAKRVDSRAKAAAQQARAPRPVGTPAARPMPMPATVANGAKRAPGRAIRTSAMGEPMTLPAPADYGAVDGGLVDGQMVPGSMRISEGGAMNGPVAGGPGMGGPMPMGGRGVGMPPVPVRGDGPNMPNYAWPSYAAYPNYAALQYPTQYSPTAWPYIGPFYPYPQVPLGWRRVSLEWDDGWWFLDFDDRHQHSHHR